MYYVMSFHSHHGKHSLLNPEVVKLLSGLFRLSMIFILLINVKMPTIVGILSFISRIDTRLRVIKQEKSLFFRKLVFYGQFEFHAQVLSMKKFYILLATNSLKLPHESCEAELILETLVLISHQRAGKVQTVLCIGPV